ncbi:carboxypeptidase M32 [Flavihumibacter petaseus]|uniref:Metal-dependent carboxypeptidase n=1 Tax=Flavihumibacter petaseus NBRC 106054 TaxID=1220578 RepID=A0A0E9MW01_9BACT|nr:carboxypeptidase M32 [Flavihumibacter petaseus]GAO41305.1 carboxypeptidase Taq [Flavihumibacter petaseus NBRC 106054]
MGYENYVDRMREIADIRYATAVLQWDQETYMPEAGADGRSRQIATLSELAHSRFTDPAMGDLVSRLRSSGSTDPMATRNLDLTAYDFDQASRLPAAFVRRMSETVSKAFQAWVTARSENNFNRFAPILETLVTLKKEEAALLGFEGHPYNALLNQYERGCTTDLLDKIFGALRGPLQQLIDRIGTRPQVDNAIFRQYFPETDQWAFSLDMLKLMGFDTSAGRQDKSAHPFTTNFSSRDVRITTRIDENDLSYMTWSTIHELGHALYEQGLPESQYGLPLGEYASLSIHESQSRLWENNVGRSLAWSRNFLPLLLQYFPMQFHKTNPDQLYRAANRVEPSLIRTEADELTYHFHVLIRYEIEKSLIGGDLSVNDIPDAWAAGYKRYLGIEVPDNSRGCLQDVHWSHGSFGYFPTYSLGSLYAAQFFAAAAHEIPDLSVRIEKGEYHLLLDWLRKKVHMHGRFFTSEELCREVTGEGINIGHFMQYVNDKYRFIYAFQPEEAAI